MAISSKNKVIRSKAARPLPADRIKPRKRKLARWGNSLGFRIPRDVVDQLDLRDGAEVDIEVGPGCLTIKPARKKWTEAELLRGVTPEIIGGEVDWGGPVGKEVG